VHNRQYYIKNFRRQIGQNQIIDFEAIINTKLDIPRLRLLVSKCQARAEKLAPVDREFIESDDAIDAKKLDRLLQISARYDCLDLAEFLLENGADVDVEPERRSNFDRNDTGRERPISWASSKGHEDIVRLLLAYGAEIDYYPSSALKDAVKKGHIGTVRLLLDFGADLDSDELRLAVENDHADVARVLLEHGANVHDMIDDILFLPVINGRLDVVYVLLEYGATVKPYYVRRADGHAKNHLAIAKLLKQHGLAQAIIRGNLDGVKEFIELGAQVQPWMVKSTKKKGQTQIASELKQHGLRQAVGKGD
jgi:ankyrin repeat protein